MRRRMNHQSLPYAGSSAHRLVLHLSSYNLLMSELTVESPPVAQVSGNRVCAGCQEIRTQLRNRLPRGWKRLGDQTFCETCWQRRYLLRSIAVPIASPLDQDWQSFRRTLREMWQLTTQASNWMVTELYSLDAAFARCGENAADGAALSVSGGAH